MYVWVMTGEALACLGKLGWTLWFLKRAIAFPVCPEPPWLTHLTGDDALSPMTMAAWALEPGFLKWGCVCWMSLRWPGSLSSQAWHLQQWLCPL